MKSKVKSLFVPLSLLLVLSFAIVVGRKFVKGFETCGDLQVLIVSLGWWGPLAYILLSVLLIMLFVPRTLIMVLGGICFGAFLGTIWVLLASLISSLLCFGFARTYGRCWVERTFKKRKWFNQLEQITSRSGFYFVLLSRITHILHFGATSYACGVLNLSWIAFLWGTFWGIFPGTLIAVYSAEVLGCGLWEGRSGLSSTDVYRLILASLLVLVSSLIPLFMNRKKIP